jgi:hypothetical protein
MKTAKNSEDVASGEYDAARAYESLCYAVVMTPVVTPVRVYVQHGVDRDLQLGTEHRTRVQRAYFTVEGAPVVTLYGLRGYCAIRLVAVSWDMGMPLPSVNVTVRKVRKDGTLGERSFGTRLFSESEIPDWLAPVIAEHTPEWAR